MELPDTVLVFKLLDAAKVSADERKLCLTVTKENTYVGITAAIKQVFLKSMTNDIPHGSGVSVKSEEAFYSFRQKNNSNRRSYQRSSKYSKAVDKIGGKKLNPLQDDGTRSKCRICGSILHWQNDCPANDKPQSVRSCNIICGQDNSDSDSVEEVHLVLFTENVDEQTIFVAEAAMSAVIDTACTKTVAGNQWFDDYCSKLGPKRLCQIQYFPSDTMFKFGDGRKVQAKQRVLMPIEVAGKCVSLETEIVQEKLPLLLSKSSLQKAGAIIDMNNDKATFLGKEIDLDTTTSGHYCISIGGRTIANTKNSSALLTEAPDNTCVNDVLKIASIFPDNDQQSWKKRF